MSEKHEQSDIIALPDECLGQRLDKVLATTYPELSRSRLVSLLKSGALRLYDRQGTAVDAAPAMRLRGGESVQILLCTRLPATRITRCKMACCI